KSTNIPTTNNAQPSSPQSINQPYDGEDKNNTKQKRNEDTALEKLIKAQEELIRISNKCLLSVKSAMQLASENRIIAMNLTGMDEESMAYWKKKKRSILDCQECQP
ncbi:hypothetical protein VP01_1867g4, partial [Puccinia sorghi]